MSSIKTPVTILQEMMTKFGTLPKYEVFKDKLDTDPSMFTAKVICHDKITIGKGRSKQNAKQNAAKAMLKEFDKCEDKTNPSIDKCNAVISDVSPHDINMADTVKKLKNFCVKYNLEEPTYINLNVSGLPPNLIHTVKCIVSTFKVTGMGKTKKEAENDATNKMIEQLTQVYCGKSVCTSVKKGKNDEVEILKNNNKTTLMNSVMNAHNINLKINYDLNTYIKPKELMQHSNYYSYNFTSLLEQISIKIKEHCQNLTQENILKVKQDFQHLLESADIDFDHMLIQTTEPESFMIIIQLNTDPDVLEMSLGKTREDAELRTMNKVIETLKKIFLNIFS